MRNFVRQIPQIKNVLLEIVGNQGVKLRVIAEVVNSIAAAVFRSSAIDYLMYSLRMRQSINLICFVPVLSLSMLAVVSFMLAQAISYHFLPK